MKNIFFIGVILSMLSCRVNKNDIDLLQRFSSKEVIIKPDIYSSTRDSLKVEIPLEVIIYNNSEKDFNFLDLDFIYNKKYVSTMDDFFITDTKNRNLSRFELKLRKKDSIALILRTRATYISNNSVKEVFKKYAINKDVEKFRDSAILISYNKFRKDFPNVIKNLEKTPDSLQITIRKELGNNYQAKRFKINW